MDKITPARRSDNMRAIRSKDMKPEKAVRSMAHAMGYRFRLHRKDLPGKPDLVFPGRHAVIFVHGCFWHQHPSPDCKDSRPPKSNPHYWGPKLERNKARDVRNTASLEAQGWRVLVLWECQTKDEAATKSLIRAFLDYSASQPHAPVLRGHDAGAGALGDQGALGVTARNGKNHTLRLQEGTESSDIITERPSR